MQSFHPNTIFKSLEKKVTVDYFKCWLRCKRTSSDTGLLYGAVRRHIYFTYCVRNFTFHHHFIRQFFMSLRVFLSPFDKLSAWQTAPFRNNRFLSGHWRSYWWSMSYAGVTDLFHLSLIVYPVYLCTSFFLYSVRSPVILPSSFQHLSL